MFPELLLSLLLMQGVPVAANQSGTVSGILRDSAGKPIAGVRVSAMAKPDSPGDLASASALASIAETDEAGRYRLENIPPGQYYIGAGRVDGLTYYPGTLDMNAGRIVAITPGVQITGIDFAMKDASVRQPFSILDMLMGSAVPSYQVSLHVKTEDGGKIPVFSGRGFVKVRLTPFGGSSFQDARINADVIPLPTDSGEYRVSIDNLPENYAIKSMTFGPSDLRTGTLKVTAASFAPMPLPAPTPTSTTSVIVFLTSRPASTAKTAIEITLTASLPPPAPGVRVSGKTNGAGIRSIYLSGSPGTIYSDGTFEFRGVPPGRHVIATADNSGALPLVAKVAVGDQDVDGVNLSLTKVLPFETESPTAPKPLGSQPAGSIIPLASLQGHVVDDATREVLPHGMAFITGVYGTSMDLDENGRFEFKPLLPGTYDVEVQAFEHKPVRKKIVIDDASADLEFALEKN